MNKPNFTNESLTEKAKKIKFVLTDSDGVLTDTSVYYSDEGEIMKRFSIRDGKGVERLRNLVGIETGIITGEKSGSVKKRAEKLRIADLYLYCKDKSAEFRKILSEKGLLAEEVAYIGDDANDVEILAEVGLSACPADAMYFVRDVVDYVCENKGGSGAFRELAELIIIAKSS